MLGGNDLASICVEIPYLVKYDKINRFNELIDNIKSDINYKYNENHYSKDIFDPKYLNYMDIIIDNEEFETDDESIIEFLNDIIDIKSYSKLNDEYYAKISNILQKQNGHFYFEENNETISSNSDSSSSNLIPDNLKN